MSSSAAEGDSDFVEDHRQSTPYMNHFLSFYPARLLLCGLLLAASAGNALATLGQAPSPPATPSSTPSQWPGTRKLAVAPAVPSSLYSLHESQLQNGTTIQEFATPAGVVFAVAWRGPVLPDLSALLGGYFNAFKLGVEQASLSGRRGSPVSVQRDGLVIKSNGRMRNFFGYAYAPDLIPVGVNVNDLFQ
jgi:hypothetical protein